MGDGLILALRRRYWTARNKLRRRLGLDRTFDEIWGVDTAGYIQLSALKTTDNAATPFGDVECFYVVPVAQFQGFKQEAGEPGEFALVSMFRTAEGAQDFVDLAAGFGYQATILPERVRSLGGLYAGLGQEANQDGSGPLVAPVAESLP